MPRKCRKGMDERDVDYFLDKCSQITPEVYLGSLMASRDRHKLIHELDILNSSYNNSLIHASITHIVNCGEEPNQHPDHFEYFNFQVATDMSQQFAKVSAFMQKCIAQNGKVGFCSVVVYLLKVLVSGETEMVLSAAVVIAYLMNEKNWDFYEAWIFVKQQRYTVNIPDNLIAQLVEWGHELKKKCATAVAHYQCLCGASTFTLLEPFELNGNANPRSCCCEVTRCAINCLYCSLEKIRTAQILVVPFS